MEGNLSSATVSIVGADLPPTERPNVLLCFICLEPPTDPISTACGHAFCWPCMHQWIQNWTRPCPVCRLTLRGDLDIIPLHGVGEAREESSNGNERRCRPGEIAASDSLNTPPRPRNPLLVDRASASTDDDATVIENFHSRSYESSVISAYQRSINELGHAFNVERGRAQDMVSERITLLLQQNKLLHGNSILRRELQERHWELFLVRNDKSWNDARLNALKREKTFLLRQAEACQARERRLVEREIQMEEHIARLRKLLDRANQKLPPG